MKKLSFLFTFIIATTLFISCQNSDSNSNSKGVSKAEDVGKHTFNLLKSLENITKEEYVQKLFTVEEIKEFGKKNADSLSERAKADIEGVTKVEYDERMIKDYNSLRKIGLRADIVWNNIKYKDYDFKKKEEDGLSGTLGKLSFTHNGKNYAVRVSTFFTENQYILIGIRRLTEEKN
ncbi:hypothetical protein [Kordia sp.]|uniref:hypothetical protein n=1 Tax=Kordia sp. TaxID=1965332 RepID=UPI003B5BEDE7